VSIIGGESPHSLLSAPPARFETFEPGNVEHLEQPVVNGLVLAAESLGLRVPLTVRVLQRLCSSAKTPR